MGTNEDEHEREGLPFEVALERTPAWAHGAAVAVIVVSGLVAAKVVSIFALLPFLVVSSLGRRFASAAKRVEVDEDGLELDGRTIPRAALRDVWVDDDPTEPRVVVAFGDDVEIVVLGFENREQARRFGEALEAKGARTRGAVVGHRPKWIDTLSSLRFVAIAAAFFATGSPYGLFVLVFFALGLWTVTQAKQVVLTGDGFEVRSLLGAETYARDDVADVDTDAGVVTMKSGAEIRLPRSCLRDATLASGTWLERGRTRVLERLRARRAVD